VKVEWTIKLLGDLCNIELGKTPDRSNPAYWDEKGGTGNVWLSIADLLKAENRIVADSKEYVSDKGAALCKVVTEGTLLVSFKLTLGRLAFAGRNLLTNEAIAALTIHNERELSKEFLFYCLTFFDWVKAAETDVKLKGMTLNKAKLKLIPISFPPLTEQHRIVTLLDEAFANIATAKANAEKNLQNAREIFERYLSVLFSEKGNGWEVKRIEDWCDSIMDCVNKTAPIVEVPTPYKMLRTTNIRNGRVDVSTVRYVSEETYKIWTRRQIPRSGDVILTREAPMGEVGMLLSEDKVFLGQRLVSYRTNPKVLDNHFLLFALQSSDLQNQIHAKASGSTVQHMRVPDTKNLLLAAPTLARQREIVIELTKIRDASKCLESIYRQKLTALDDLKKSLLHQAFSGRL
jgi:type I restriction enzyme S subunit